MSERIIEPEKKTDFPEYGRRAKEFLNLDKWEPSTASCYKTDLNLFGKLLDSERINGWHQINPETFTRFFEEQSSRGVKPLTIERRASSLRSFFRWLGSQQDNNLPENFNLPESKHPIVVRENLSLSELERITAAAKNQFEKMLVLLSRNGLTTGMIAKSKIKDLTINSESETATINVHVHQRNKKTREIRLTENTTLELNNYLATRNNLSGNDPLVTHRIKRMDNDEGMTRQGVWLNIKKVIKRAKSSCTPQDIVISSRNLINVAK